MSDHIIGTCSQCQGPVVVPQFMVDPIPYCKQCGAHKKQPYGPVIEMVPTKRPDRLSV